ncbi:hypothetical protein [Fischerella sp. PCC 9605]|uniref:hypothetical protein n=1 Tax=Fischerella sp. PCC 9605 TaxID=1173024 RepID=UPI00047E2702|nr:hypothetical protein [Fischerella sp. PCC 9605]
MKTAMIGAAFAVLSLSVPALAATTTKYQVKGESASANFSQYDGCNETSVYVSAYSNITKSQPGAPTSQKEAFVSYSNYNYCTGEGSYGYGSITNPNFTINNSLSSASLNDTFTVYDYLSGTNKTVNVALTWTGTGDTYRGNYHSHNQGPGYIYKYRGVGAWRDAQVSGSVTLDGTNLIANLPLSYAQLGSSNSGSLEIIKK